MSDAELQAIIARAQQNNEKKTKNNNILAADDPRHTLTENSVTKSNALARAYYRLSLVEKRCMESLLSKLHPLRTDNQLQHIELCAREYAEAFPDVGKHAYEHLTKAGDALVERVIMVESPAAGVARDKLTLMVRVRYQPQEGRIICSFNPLVIPHLIGLRDKFTKYPLKHAVDFSSTYTWRFYEILVSWAQPASKSGGRLMGWINKQSVEELRKMLGVPKSYTWGMFQKQVLNVVTSELRGKAEIAIFIERSKTGRKITHLNIRFIEGEQIPLKLENQKI